ncbi:hypothetical protein [Clostridium manihotivorum]|uniref:Uncharacterized protein n=1 Tax=Clostridium manihotivorum TaxID=2320868 RepID=A0A3R5QSB9_9CLOT|nr:hypothetical protein [Clostridium manihotivorum]QAA31182.1 hypothetical protein C1I91_05605 [Clostridium manihotivorum]
MIESIEILVVQNYDLDCEKVFYCGDSELEAYRKYKNLSNGKRNIFKAKVYKRNFLNTPFIMKYEILEILA